MCFSNRVCLVLQVVVCRESFVMKRSESFLFVVQLKKSC